MATIKLQSSDGTIFEVDVDIAKQSVLIKNMLDLGLEDNGPVPLPNVNAFVLKKVIQWMKNNKNIPASLEDKTDDDIWDPEFDAVEPIKLLQFMMLYEVCIKEAHMKAMDEIAAWNTEFFKVDIEILYELITAANYLNITALMKATAKAIASRIKQGKTPEEMRQILKIPKDDPDEDENDEDDDETDDDPEFHEAGSVTLFDLILRAEELNIKSMLNMTAREFAKTIDRMTPEAICDTFKLKLCHHR